KLSKSQIAQSEVVLLGHQVSLEGIRPSEEKVAAVRRASFPQTKSELRSFLGLTGYLRRFIPYYADICAPLHDLLKKGTSFVWRDIHNEAFKRLQNEVCEHVLLAAPRGDGPLIIVADASDRGIGSALIQIQEGEPAILEFAAKRLTQAEKKWDTREKEAYAI